MDERGYGATPPLTIENAPGTRPRRPSFARTALCIPLIVSLAACGGGGAGNGTSTLPAAPAPPSATATPSGSVGTAQVSITIPQTSSVGASSQRRALYVSVATNSLSVTPAGGSATVIPLTPGSPGCSSGTSGRTCLISMGLSVGAVSFVVRTFSSADGSGPVLSLGSATATIVANQLNPISLTLDAVVSNVQVSLAPSSFTPFTSGSATVNAKVLDAANQMIDPTVNTLVDPSDASVAVSFADTDTSGVTTLSATALGATPVSVNYSGAAPPIGATLIATARTASKVVATGSTPISFGVVVTPSPTATPGATPTPGATATPAPTATPVPIPTPSPDPTQVPGISPNPSSLAFINTGATYAQTFTVTQAGYAGAYAATTSGGDPTVATVSVAGNAVTVTAQHAGATNVIVSGGFGQTVSVPVGVTVTPITIHGRRS